MNSKKKPPDKYRCLKLHITSIFYKDNDEVNKNMDILQNAIIRTNSITSKTYFLLRLGVLHKYHNQEELTLFLCV